MPQPETAIPTAHRMPADDAYLQPDRTTGKAWKSFALASVGVLLGFILYYCTALPGVGWADTAALQYRVWRFQLKSDLGLALAHPLYILLARGFTLIPLGNFAFRVTLFTVVCGAVSLGFTFDLLRRLSGSVLAATVGTLSLAVSHTFWRDAVIAEKYALYALGLLVELWLVERFVRLRQPKWLLLALLVNGLNFSGHDLALLHAPAYLGFIVWALRSRTISPRHVALGALLFLIGSLPMTLVMVSEMIQGRLPLAVVQELLMGKELSSSVLATHFPLVHQVARSLEYFLLNFPTPLALLMPWGVYCSWRNPRLRWFVLFAGAIFVMDYVFSFRYMFPGGVFVFFISDFVIFALFIGLAVPSVMKPSAVKTILLCALALVPVVFYEFAPELARKSGISIGIQREIPLRDSYTFFLRPRKNNDQQRRALCPCRATAGGARWPDHRRRHHQKPIGLCARRGRSGTRRGHQQGNRCHWPAAGSRVDAAGY